MITGLLKKIFGSRNERLLRQYMHSVRAINALEPAIAKLTDDALIEGINARFGRPGLIVEGLRFEQCRHYYNTEKPAMQYWLDFLRRAGGSYRINLGAVEAYREQVKFEAEGMRRRVFPLM
ncbi:MAG: hypothetical protein AAB298_00535, partial [Pseudomonadota bacterium]